MSTTVQATDLLPTLPVAGAAQLWLAMPDSASLPFALGATVLLSSSVPEPTAGASVGAVRSIFTCKPGCVAALPAASWTVRGPVPTAVPSASSSCAAGQSTPPEVASPQLNSTVTAPRYQPVALGAVVALARIVGAVASRLTDTVRLVVPPALVALHV